MIHQDLDTGIELDSILIASQLARFVPTSLSVDNLRSLCLEENKEKMKDTKSKNSSKKFIPPNPKIKQQVKQEQKKECGSKFSFLLKNKKKADSKPQAICKFQYELPNVKKVFAPIKTNKPLMVVSLSAENLTTLEVKTTIKGAKQVDSSDSSSYSSDYSDSE